MHVLQISLKKHSARYLFLLTHKILRTLITLNLLGIALLTFPMDALAAIFTVLTRKQDGVAHKIRLSRDRHIMAAVEP